MDPFKKIRELNRTIAILSRKTGRKAVRELSEARGEIVRLNRIIEANPCLVVVR